MSTGTIDVRDVYNFMAEKNIIISFLGDFNHRIVTSLLSSIKKILNGIEADYLVKKRLYNIVVECLENIARHSEANSQPDQPRFNVSTIFTIAKTEEGFDIVTGNFIQEESIPAMRERLEKVNSLDKEGLQDMYRNKLIENPPAGGGLGIIDISIKSGCKLSYEFKPVRDGLSFFILQTTVSN
jgi:hypothetical protein